MRPPTSYVKAPLDSEIKEEHEEGEAPAGHEERGEASGSSSHFLWSRLESSASGLLQGVSQRFCTLIEFTDRVSQGIALMDGQVVNEFTLAELMRPMLLMALPQAGFRDSSGAIHGGGGVQVIHPGIPGRAFNLRLVFDDSLDEALSGRCLTHGSDQAEIILYMRNIGSSQSAANILFHECSHLLLWLNEMPGASMPGPHRAVMQLDREVEVGDGVLSRQIAALVASVTGSRQAPGNGVNHTEIQRVESQLLEETHVLSMTEVFEKSLYYQAERRRSGRVIVSYPERREDTLLSDRFVTNRLFGDIGAPLLGESDRERLTERDRDLIHQIGEVLRGKFRVSVIHGFRLPPLRPLPPPPRIPL